MTFSAVISKVFVLRMEKPKKMTVAERKRKSHGNLAKNMTEQEKLDFKKN